MWFKHALNTCFARVDWDPEPRRGANAKKPNSRDHGVFHPSSSSSTCFFVAVSSGGTHGAPRPQPRQAPPRPPRSPRRRFSPPPRTRPSSGNYHPPLPLRIRSLIRNRTRRFRIRGSSQGGEEKTRYCTDHAELFRFFPAPFFSLFWIPFSPSGTDP